MPVKAWSAKRERQYEHIKEGLEERGTPDDKAEEIAARTVNKERARAGEAKEASRTSIDDISSSRRGGLRSHSGSGGRTYAQLRNEARDRGVKGRSTMSKARAGTRPGAVVRRAAGCGVLSASSLAEQPLREDWRERWDAGHRFDDGGARRRRCRASTPTSPCSPSTRTHGRGCP